MSGARPEGKAAELFADLPELETERLLLRKMRLSDAEAMFSYASDPEVTRHVLWETHGSMVESENFLRFAGEGYERGDFGGWGVVLKASGPSWEPAAWRPPPNIRAPSSGTCWHVSIGEGASCRRRCGA